MQQWCSEVLLGLVVVGVQFFQREERELQQWQRQQLEPQGEQSQHRGGLLPGVSGRSLYVGRFILLANMFIYFFFIFFFQAGPEDLVSRARTF